MSKIKLYKFEKNYVWVNVVETKRGYWSICWRENYAFSLDFHTAVRLREEFRRLIMPINKYWKTAKMKTVKFYFRGKNKGTISEKKIAKFCRDCESVGTKKYCHAGINMRTNKTKCITKRKKK